MAGSLNRKYIAIIVVVLLALLFLFIVEVKRKNKIKKKNKLKKLKKLAKSNNPNNSAPETIDEAIEDEPEDVPEEIIDDAAKDAKELYHLVHEPLSKGVTMEEFKQLAGNLADTQDFINLKQLYNSYINSGQDTNKITVKHYAEILRSKYD